MYMTFMLYNVLFWSNIITKSTLCIRKNKVIFVFLITLAKVDRFLLLGSEKSYGGSLN